MNVNEIFEGDKISNSKNYIMCLHCFQACTSIVVVVVGGAGDSDKKSLSSSLNVCIFISVKSC